MFLMLPCPTITDNVKFIPQGELVNKISQLNQTRSLLHQLSDTAKLINRVQNGQIMIHHKVKFDQYLKTQVDMMKICVASHNNCQFKYNGFATSKSINTTLMLIKQQWGFQILMSRYILSSIYMAGAIQSIGKLFEETNNSYHEGYKNTPEFTKNLQITFKYFNEGFDPLKRLYPVIDSVEQLFQKQNLNQYLQSQSSFFKFFTQLCQTNLAYIKIQKYRILCEYRSCKQAAWAVYERFKELKSKISNFVDFQLTDQISNFINLGIVFYKAYALNSLLLQNENKKIQEEYGFIKKQFQEMVFENLVIADQIINLKNIAAKLPGQQLDNVIFANRVLQVMAEHAEKAKYRYNIDLHETKMQKPSINTITMRIVAKNIWDALSMF